MWPCLFEFSGSFGIRICVNVHVLLTVLAVVVGLMVATLQETGEIVTTDDVAVAAAVSVVTAGPRCPTDDDMLETGWGEGGHLRGRVND